MIHLHTLGDALITVGEKEIRPSSPMVFAALLYLGVERGRRVPRAALQELLFQDSDERSGSHSVRQLLYKLRQLGVPITADESTVALSTTSVVDDCVIVAASQWSDRDASIAALGFVPDFHPCFSDRFRAWLELQRTTVASRVRAALVELLLDKRQHSNWKSVTAVAEALLAIDPLNEEATLALAEATAALGGKHRAIVLLTAYERETGKALRVAPSILRQRISENVSDTAPTDQGLLPLFGRSEELSTIVQRITRPQPGHSRMCVLVGEPGIGKSRLLEEVLRGSTVAGVRPFVARCRVHHSSRPLSVFIDLVPELLSSPGSLGVNPDSLRYLRQLVHGDPQTPLESDLEDDVGRMEVLRRALIDLLDAVSSEQRIVLALEDVHWCDSVSLKELGLIISHLGSVTVVCTTRSIDCLKGSVADIAEFFRLQPLAAGHMNDMAASLLADRADTRTQLWCASVASGNPLFLSMLCRHVRETGSCSVPEDLHTIIASRLQLLDDLHLRALQYIALLGANATLTALQQLLELPSHRFVESIALLDDQEYFIIRDNRLSLTHDLVGEAALRLAPCVTRRALHAHVAHFLETQYENTGGMATLWDCAEQWRLSGELQRSVGLLRRCASHASTLGYSSKALEMLQHASQLTSDASQRESILSDGILAARAAGQLKDVLSLGANLKPMSSRAHSDVELMVIEAEWLLRGTLDVNQLLICVECSEVSTHHKFEACLLLQRYAHEMCDELLAERAYSAVMDLRTSASHMDRLLVDVVYHATFGNSAQGVRAIEELRTLAPTLSSVVEQLRAARSVIVGLLVSGRPADAIATADYYRRRATELGLYSRVYEFTALMSVCFIATEEWERGAQWMQELETPPDARWVTLTNQLRVQLAFWRKDARQAREFLIALEEAANDEGTRNQAFICSARLRLKQLSADFVCSEAEFRDFFAVYERTKRFVSDDDLAMALAEDLRRRGRPFEALALLDSYVSDARRQAWVLPAAFQSLRTHLSVATALDRTA